MSIIKALEKIASEKLVSFHVPGHKNGRLLSAMALQEKLGYYDTTEIEGTDNLHAPEGAIKDAQKRAAVFYGAIESFYLVNGTTGGNIAMMYAAFKPGDKVLISRDAHKSVFSGMILSGVQPVYISPKVDTSLGLNLGIQVDQVREAFDKHPDLKGLVMTYPSYHGICGDIEKIEKIVHEADALLLVDAAHGAHLNLSDALPLCALKAGADIVVQSTHKSLPSFTQSSLLHYNSQRVSLSRLKMALAMFQSSSPSYLLMASIENAIKVAEDKGRAYMQSLLENIDVFEKKLEDATCFSLLKASMLPKSCRLDPSKITLLTDKRLISGGALDKRLRDSYGIQCEYGTDSTILFITSIATSKEDLDKLFQALKDISQEIQAVGDQPKNEKETAFDFTSFDLNCQLQPSEATYMTPACVKLSDAIGYPAGEFIVPYPPGIPIVVPGEVISKQVVNFIEEGIRKGYNINGVYKLDELQVTIIRR